MKTIKQAIGILDFRCGEPRIAVEVKFFKKRKGTGKRGVPLMGLFAQDFPSHHSRIFI